MSFRDRAELARADDKIPDDTPPEGSEWYVSFFWGARSFIPSPELPLKLGDIYEYQEHCGSLLDRNDIAIIAQMDRAFREQYPKTVAAHEKLRERNNK